MSNAIHEALTEVRAACPMHLVEAVKRLKDAIDLELIAHDDLTESFARLSIEHRGRAYPARCWDEVVELLFVLVPDRMVANGGHRAIREAVLGTVRELVDLSGEAIAARLDSTAPSSAPTHLRKPVHGGRAV